MTNNPVYILSISISNPDPCERMLFSMVVDDTFLHLMSENENDTGLPDNLVVDNGQCIRSDKYDFMRLAEYEELPKIYASFVNWLLQTDNWCKWMDDANVIGIGLAI